MPSAKSRLLAKHGKSVSPAETAQQNSQQITPRLLTIKQAATYLSATVWSVRELLWTDTISHIVIGKRHLIDRGDLDRYIDTQLNKSAHQAKATASRIAARVSAQ